MVGVCELEAVGEKKHLFIFVCMNVCGGWVGGWVSR